MILQFTGCLKLPIYHINSEQIRILKTPQDLFHSLLDHIENANKRIILSTLYIGTGSLENELVTALTKAVRERNVKLTILMDATRGLRPCLTTNYYTINANNLSSTTNLLELPPSYSSCHFLAPLTTLPNVSILLYRHPFPYKWIRYMLPNRWNEIFGVQHIKAYIFDDSVIMSGLMDFSKGASGYIPLAYREALIQLLQLFYTTKLNHSNINIYEYIRPDWTFHAKGLWIESVADDSQDEEKKTADHHHPSYSLSLVGSSNFSYRSLNRDLESQLCIVTTNPKLRQCLYNERCHLFSSTCCYPITLNQLIYQTKYRLPVYVRFLLPIFRWYM
ncbi:LOW QUALITY PROTEIN: CDP-diacylglycerol--glycerol-3-phosphate 3-phosphatidyltransferase [Schistosoma mansoni]|uniref:CDP-diacylglycerol--glycerol-3-phosphate 3-phosphatidyltransferase n=1 Tax=Schistosoma mansoni TaxID=6183 RepID=UPI00022DC379|nr:LOW QUALITY PROTEIN: CDP-diacylglycerol--glycerol-3-phosphate 3-phosphatidyltransferase [Schistosoma mansoni]|eukprot:XP_018652079.1 LOW QUALITY PROTEIN: CDP-diacylglycerol--glycerol-3-phosphate 3-phosphatidyltransferase [Schistosoma mansoni]